MVFDVCNCHQSKFLGPVVQTTSLVNETLKFQTLIFQICQYFLSKKCEKVLQWKSFSHFFNKNITVFGYKVIKHLTSWPLNELVKLTMLWTTGPWSLTWDSLWMPLALFVISFVFSALISILYNGWNQYSPPYIQYRQCSKIAQNLLSYSARWHLCAKSSALF